LYIHVGMKTLCGVLSIDKLQTSTQTLRLT